MILNRRTLLVAGGFNFAGLAYSFAAPMTHDVAMVGTADGSKVWFEPAVLEIRSGDTVRWTNKDAGNSHTSTAYHPDNDGHPLRIPESAVAWDSYYLLPDESFSVIFQVPGTYEYYCTPHEHAGMTGRIVVFKA
jgi:plastocyanin